MKRKITISLDQSQERELEILMAQDGQKNFTYYFVYLIMQEKKRRVDGVQLDKRLVGRPRKSDDSLTEDTNKYPSPYKGGAPYSKQDLEMYYDFRNVPMPPLPKPLTKAQIKEFDQK